MSWKALQPGPAPQLSREVFQARRRAVAAGLEADEVLLVATHAPQKYSNDVDPRFRPHSDFWYLTGFEEPDCLLVLDHHDNSTLFLQTKLPEAEVWTGRRLGVEAAPEILGVDHALPIDELNRRIEDVVAGRNVRAVVDHHARLRNRLRQKVGTMEDGGPLVAEHRIRKDDKEIRMLQKAADVGAEAMRDAAPLARSGNHEYLLEAELLRAFRAAGSTGPGYPPIVGAGRNAAVLHYIANRDRIGRHDLVLVDAGCEWGYYNSDITRTFPVDGQWTDKQRRLYDLVHDARDAALEVTRPGNRLIDVHNAAAEALADGLQRLGYLDGTLEEILDKKSYRRFFMHGTSHFLGIDVHDVGGYKDSDGKSRTLEKGMVITIEPGLYFNPDFTPCPSGTAGIGIRIEDDVVVTGGKPKVLTGELPRDADAVAGMVRGR